MEVYDVLTTNYLMRKCAGVLTCVVKPRDPISPEVSLGWESISPTPQSGEGSDGVKWFQLFTINLHMRNLYLI